jgi:hypothetical protein
MSGLNLASNWSRLFPHESAAAGGLAAVRSGHVMYIEAAAGNGQWLIRDYNSGGGLLAHMHVRDVRGYAFVNPRARRWRRASQARARFYREYETRRHPHARHVTAMPR